MHQEDLFLASFSRIPRESNWKRFRQLQRPISLTSQPTARCNSVTIIHCVTHYFPLSHNQHLLYGLHVISSRTDEHASCVPSASLAVAVVKLHFLAHRMLACGWGKLPFSRKCISNKLNMCSRFLPHCPTVATHLPSPIF